MQTQAKNNQGGNVGGCDNVISFADFVACMAERERYRPMNKPRRQDKNTVIYIGDLR